MKITKAQLKQIIKEELAEARIDQSMVTAGPEGEQAVMHKEIDVETAQEKATRLFGNRMNIDISEHAYRMGQHLGAGFVDDVAKALNKVAPLASQKMILGSQHGFGEED